MRVASERCLAMSAFSRSVDCTPTTASMPNAITASATIASTSETPRDVFCLPALMSAPRDAEVAPATGHAHQRSLGQVDGAQDLGTELHDRRADDRKVTPGDDRTGNDGGAG